MANWAQGVNPEILKWARERAGYSVQEIAESFKKAPEVILGWESGDAVPTYNQLERLADSFYKRPIALFFFPQPPDEPDPSQSFRTLPDSESQNLLPDTRHAIQEAKAMQLTLLELTDGVNPSERKIFNDIQLHSTSKADAKAREVREYLKVSLDQQVGWVSREEALKEWRQAIQDCGIFVFKRSFKQADVSGFSLWDDVFPVIYINNSTPTTRQIFTLFHELAHILLDSNGITKLPETYTHALQGRARQVEVLCNQFAAEVLVPSSDFDERLELSIVSDSYIKHEADRYQVSREVILRKLLDRGHVTPEEYATKTQQWQEEYQDWQATRKDGGSYYATQAAYLGENYLTLAFNRYYNGDFSIQELAGFLNIKAKSVAQLEEFVFGRGVKQ